MKKKIAVLPGDGIGPEITKEAIKVLKAVEQYFNHQFEYNYGAIGAVAIQEFNNPFPKATRDLCLNSEAILFGAIGHPDYDNNPECTIRPEHGLLEMRKTLGLFANIRPIKFYNALKDISPLKNSVIKNSNFVVIRELTGGIYYGERGRSENGNSAYDTNVYNVKEIERVAKVAFEYAQNRSGKLTVVDKANVLETSRLWRDTINKMKSNYEDVDVDFLFVDNAAMQIILAPSRFDVILTENMFGDILTDEASVVTGSLGMIPSASIGEKTSLFEPIHGSFPEAAGKNIANPLATILSAALMLENAFNMKTEANAIREAVLVAIEKGIVTKDISHKNEYYSTSEIGDFLSDFIINYKHKGTFVSLEQDYLMPEVI